MNHCFLLGSPAGHHCRGKEVQLCRRTPGRSRRGLLTTSSHLQTRHLVSIPNALVGVEHIKLYFFVVVSFFVFPGVFLLD